MEHAAQTAITSETEESSESNIAVMFSDGFSTFSMKKYEFHLVEFKQDFLFFTEGPKPPCD